MFQPNQLLFNFFFCTIQNIILFSIFLHSLAFHRKQLCYKLTKTKNCHFLSVIVQSVKISSPLCDESRLKWISFYANVAYLKKWKLMMLKVKEKISNKIIHKIKREREKASVSVICFAIDVSLSLSLSGSFQPHLFILYHIIIYRQVFSPLNF